MGQTNWIKAEHAAAVVPRLARLLAATVGEGCRLSQLSMPQVKVLSHIFRNPGETMTALAGELGIALGTASETVDRLVELQMVERMTNPSNRRQVLLSLTPDAEAITRELGRQRVEQLAEVFAQLSEAETDGFLRGLDLWVETLQQRVATAASVATTPRSS